MSNERPLRVVNPVQFYGPGESWSAEHIQDARPVYEEPVPEPEPEEAQGSIPDPPDDGDDEPDDPPSEEDDQLGLLDDPAADD